MYSAQRSEDPASGYNQQQVISNQQLFPIQSLPPIPEYAATMNNFFQTFQTSSNHLKQLQTSSSGHEQPATSNKSQRSVDPASAGQPETSIQYPVNQQPIPIQSLPAIPAYAATTNNLFELFEPFKQLQTISNHFKHLKLKMN